MPNDEPLRLRRHAPILLIPDALGPELRAVIMAQFERELPTHLSDGRATVGFDLEPGDFYVEHEGEYGRMLQLVMRGTELTRQLDEILTRVVQPAIAKAFQTRSSSREHWLATRYEAPTGFVAAHRDNATPATKHRNFTLTVNLNGGAYEGGELRFPEYGPELYAPDPGTAVIWSAAVLHEVLPVTRGQRFIIGSHLSGLQQQQRWKVKP